MTEIKMGLTIEEAAECTGIGRNTMRKLVDWGKLPVLKVGRKTIIRRDTLERFMTVNQGRISLIQAMYEKWNNRSPKPSAFESEIHPSHKSSICTLGISLREPVSHFGHHHLSYDTEEIAPQFPLLSHQSPIAVTAASDKSVA